MRTESFETSATARMDRIEHTITRMMELVMALQAEVKQQRESDTVAAPESHDYFAGCAITGLAGSGKPEAIAKQAVAIADAMVQEDDDE